MGQDTDQIRQEIADTRDQMGETVEAIGYKTNVKARTRDNISGKVDAVRERIAGPAGAVSDAASSLGDRASSLGDSAPSTDDVKRKAGQAVGLAQENPLGLAIGAVSIGFIAGLLLPSTRIENAKLGPIADDVKSQIKEAGQDAFEKGKAVAGDAVQAAQENAADAARQTKDAVQDSAAQHA